MRSFFCNKRLLAGLLICALVGLGLPVWLAGTPLRAWWAVRNLAIADEATQAVWVARTVQLEQAAIPALLRCLERQEPVACANAQAALSCLADRWGHDDPRVIALEERLSEAFPRCSMTGQCRALELMTHWLQLAPSTPLADAVSLMTQGARAPDKEVRRRALGVAAVLLARPDRAPAIGSCREIVRVGLGDTEAVNRAFAVRLAVHPDIDLSRSVAPLLGDAAPEVRQAALLAIGCIDEAIATDDLLHALHDSDADVRRLCEAALRGRGLRPNDIVLGRLITDEQPAVRLRVLERLARVPDLDPGVWLRRMTLDPSPAVRAAAVRAAGEQEQIDFTDRLEKMARTDSSATVRQVAQFYLERHRARQVPLLDR